MNIIAKTKFLEFKSAKSPSNKDWFYVKRTNDTPNNDSAVVITTIVKHNNKYNFLLLKTTRPPLSAENKAKFCLESPAGLIADNNCNETMLECAKKELLEESGLVTNDLFIELKNSATSAGLSSETLSYVTAIVDKYEIKSKPVSDGGIILDRILVPVSEIYDYLKNINQQETSIAAATICGIFYTLKRIE